MIEHITLQDIIDNNKLLECMNNLIDKINEITYVLDIPLSTIKSSLTQLEQEKQELQNTVSQKTQELQVKEQNLQNYINSEKLLNDRIKELEESL